MKFLLSVLCFLVLVFAISATPRCRDNLNYDIDQLLRVRFSKLIGETDDIGRFYSNLTTGGLTYWNGTTYNQNVIAAIAFGLFNRYTSDPSTADIVYSDELETVQGIFNISEALTAFTVGVKLFGEMHVLGGVTVEQLGDDLFQVNGSADVQGRVAPLECALNPFCTSIPTQWSETVPFVIYGSRAHQYTRVCENNTPVFYLSRVIGISILNYWNGTLFSVSSGPLYGPPASRTPTKKRSVPQDLKASIDFARTLL